MQECQVQNFTGTFQNMLDFVVIISECQKLGWDEGGGSPLGLGGG